MFLEDVSKDGMGSCENDDNDHDNPYAYDHISQCYVVSSRGKPSLLFLKINASGNSNCGHVTYAIKWLTIKKCDRVLLAKK